MENEISIDDLHADPMNPRVMSKHDAEALDKSMEKFGDLSSIVLNIRTKQLVGGHRRIDTLLRKNGTKNVTITQRFDTPDDVGTVALGYVTYNGKQFPFRAVDWDLPTQRAANIAANRIQGQFDMELLAEVNYMLADTNAELLKLTGQEDNEIKKLLAMVSGEPDIALPDGDKSGFQQMTFSLSDDQAAVVNDALDRIKKTVSFEGFENANSNGNALYMLAQHFVVNANEAAAK